MPVSVFYLTGVSAGPCHYGLCMQQNPVLKQPVSAESDDFAGLKNVTDQEPAEITDISPDENEAAVEQLSSASLISNRRTAPEAFTTLVMRNIPCKVQSGDVAR
eukprot:TRINITY_DN10515_c0_g1_i5.p6 TRINITY_DN10515_c0_g1~~TRINITY_DN10515_c0_g1_i5.p6  ORF type:complete len:104 (+),score=26.93 TRINITY_DN10515_c0_g1_i5:536-847(+)